MVENNAKETTKAVKDTAASTVLERVQEILREDFPCGEDCLAPDARFVEDLGLDSLDKIRMVIAIEEEFGVIIEDTEAEKLPTIGELAKWIEEHKGGKN